MSSGSLKLLWYNKPHWVLKFNWGIKSWYYQYFEVIKCGEVIKSIKSQRAYDRFDHARNIQRMASCYLFLYNVQHLYTWISKYSLLKCIGLYITNRCILLPQTNTLENGSIIYTTRLWPLRAQVDISHDIRHKITKYIHRYTVLLTFT